MVPAIIKTRIKINFLSFRKFFFVTKIVKSTMQLNGGELREERKSCEYFIKFLKKESQ